MGMKADRPRKEGGSETNCNYNITHIEYVVSVATTNDLLTGGQYALRIRGWGLP